MTSTPAPSSPSSAAPYGAVWPAFNARDARALMAYLTDVLGFVENVVYPDGDDVGHAQLDWPEGGGIMLGTYRPDQEWKREPGSAGTYLVTADVDAAYARAQAGGADIVRPLGDTEYGSREFAVRDPEGNLWSIGTYPGSPPPRAND